MEAFTVFPNFPDHLRWMIWEAACFVDPHIFEVTTPSGHRISTPFNHQTSASFTYQTSNPFLNESSFSSIAWNSHERFALSLRTIRSIPSILHVSQEARNEAKKLYRYTEFQNTHLRTVRTYFNPLADIMYFGSGAYLGTLISLLHSDIKFSRVAIVVEEDILHDCGLCCDALSKAAEYDSVVPFLDKKVGYVPWVLRVLHGFVPQGADGTSNMFPGCNGLKDIFLCVEEGGPFEPPSDFRRGCVGFKEYTKEQPYLPLIRECGLSSDEYLKHQMKLAMATMEENRWAGDKQPNFQLTHRIQPLAGDEALEIMAVRVPGRGEHRVLWWNTHQVSGPFVIALWPPEYIGPGDYVVKFMGKKPMVGVVKKKIIADIDKAEALFKTKFRIIDIGEVVLPPSKTRLTTSPQDQVLSRPVQLLLS